MNPNDELLEGLELPETEDTDLNLDDILKEFSQGEEAPAEEAPPEEAAWEEAPGEETSPEEAPEETLRLELPKKEEARDVSGDTVRFTPISGKDEAPAEDTRPPQPPKAEPFSENWEPDYDQPIGRYVPPQPIQFHPRSRLRELKRKLVAGPEKRYYDLTELGLGKLQAAIFLSLLTLLLTAGITGMYAAGLVSQGRVKLMVFIQFLAMLISALLGAFQMIDGFAELKTRGFTLNTMLPLTFAACLADGILGLREQRVPCCAAFCLHVTMSLWGAYHRRQTEMQQRDTMRKAVRLGSIHRVADYHDGCSGLLRGEGQVEDFMDHYAQMPGPEKGLNVYALLATLASIGISVAGGILHSSLSFGVQLLSVSLLVAVPVTGFIAMTRPMALLQRRLHKLGAVHCGWQGIRGMSGRALFPVTHDDLVPAGYCKMNGVKFYGQRDPDQVVAYCAALIQADGSGLYPLFDQLLSSRNGRHYQAMHYRVYDNGGIGAEVCQEPVLMGSLQFLREMGVEVPEGIHVSHAVYAAIDGELAGVFAVTYGRSTAVAAGITTLCSYRGLRPVLIERDFMLTESFMKDRFGVNPRKLCFPDREVRGVLAAAAIPEGAPAMALVTSEGLAPFAYAVTGARAVRTAMIIGTAIHLIGGILGLLIMLALAVLGEAALLTPVHLLAFELVWLLPGLLVTEWTRSV